MVKAKTLWAARLKVLVFMSLLVGVFLTSAALSLIQFPFLPEGGNIYLFAALSFVSLLYLPPQFWPLLMVPAFFLDAVLELPLGSHLVLVIFQYGGVLIMKSSLKDYGFLSHWIVFGLSYALIFLLFTPFSFFQIIPLILIYPLILTWFLNFLMAFKQVSHG